jgi:hypothetical protein
MENTIKVGSVVFHRQGFYKGPGTVIRIQKDAMMELDCYIVLWQSSGEMMDHFRRGLLTLAEKEAAHGNA